MDEGVGRGIELRDTEETRDRRDNMAFTHFLLTRILKTEIHPFVVSIMLFDQQVEGRLELLTDIEKVFEGQYRRALSIHYDGHSRVITYSVISGGVHIQCPF